MDDSDDWIIGQACQVPYYASVLVKAPEGIEMGAAKICEDENMNVSSQYLPGFSLVLFCCRLTMILLPQKILNRMMVRD